MFIAEIARLKATALESPQGIGDEKNPVLAGADQRAQEPVELLSIVDDLLSLIYTRHPG